METSLIGKVVGILLMLSVACHAEGVKDFLSDLERRIEAFPEASSVEESSRSSSMSSSSSSSSSSARAPQITFEAPSILASPIASNLAKLISNALGTGDEGTKKKEDAKEEPSASVAEKKGEEGGEEDEEEEEESVQEGDSDVTTPIDVRLDSGEEVSVNQNATAKNSSRTDGDKVDYVPASAEQFGELGTGSKLMEYLPDFSQMSIETNDLAGIAGVGLAGLMAMTAIFAVPVAPVILRRTGNNGWAGLPSLSDLFSWWSTPEPSAEAWADKNNQGYQHHYGYDYDDAGIYTHNGQQYYTYDTTGSASDQAAAYAETDTNHLQQYAAPEEETHEYYAHAPQTAYAQQPAYQQQQQQQQLQQQQQQQPQPQQQQAPLEAYNVRQRNRRPATSVDGHEYVTLEQLNRIGEESVKYLSDLAKGYTADDFYAYRDNTESNELKRRRLQAPESHPEGRHPQRPQYQPQPSYVESQQHFTQSYLTEENKEGPEGFPHKDVFSITQPDSKEDANYETRSPYGYFSSSSGKEHSSEQQQQDSGSQAMEKQMFKVSEFPYSFERK